MATKGEQTRQRVIERVAPVFNERGYWGASLRDVMLATGLEKGGIYNHFRSKEELAEAAFAHNVDLIRQRIRHALAGRRHAGERLHAVVDVYRHLAVDPPFRGGCPILNAAVDSDDTNPSLRDRVRAVMDELRRDTFVRILDRGVERGEVRRDVDVEAAATVIVAALEGALMLAQLYRDPRFVAQATAHLDDFIDSLVDVTDEARRRTAQGEEETR